jgi:hypothetical protein
MAPADYGPTCATTGRSQGGGGGVLLLARSPWRAQRHLADFRETLQADAYAGFNKLYDGARRPCPVTEAACWAHGRRNFFELADPALRKKNLLSPIALEAVKRIDAVFAIEREINGQPAEARLAVRQQRIMPLLNELEAWMRVERARLSRYAEAAKAFDHMLTRWPASPSFCATAESASPTMPPSGRCAASRSAARRGCSPVRTEVASAPPSSTV